ncbi:MAG: hypothetical protein A2487_06310 [Candidatus Raymondbacteria bacterium RifOxyC12_full_50_8]|uniref:Lipopolysaccharide assembly protein A domain-containing protein n=1 Tax=Candidatus Raymondbacteria bacterium RIFOXYD12_FULL_49_13 TaxID=1817890 RepID=A0A1F7FC87_UNCRA|nr:MAG: hypothetical protein A2248_03210 [Candidatus Raymondbacteria bacterium RIFOXYA2_FULL_49_16]OGJ93292.1 MAG: hypothetical protein A2350_14585 [Candidatus Raymondbacteria bacterium RifOxyB12_full_50_8]OGK04253.1 MAG: hypothetical protein A2519_17995 [Candidatus Raymondbacteria bacterium RIFOXYD12_FULL_49_13]OGK06060.1 MAG: hypothetical protein A2487_06310 [Candidatus Raymondbacteria bacterium RifOxyC12_full_50_8]OGP42464.1 MAG: hypothetical protein A2324_17245 [Candidatus Raymondbacteria b
MWAIRWFFIVGILFVAVVFIMSNRNLFEGDPIEISFLIKRVEWKPYFLMLVSFGAGFLTWFVVSLFNYFKMKTELSGKNKVIKNLKDELNDYRNVSLQAGASDLEKTMIINGKESASLRVPRPESEGQLPL